MSHRVDITLVFIYIQYVFKFVWSDQTLNCVRCVFTVMFLYKCTLLYFFVEFNG